jgi:hypothetical protein
MFKRLGFSQNDINSDLSNTQYILDQIRPGYYSSQKVLENPGIQLLFSAIDQYQLDKKGTWFGVDQREESTYIIAFLLGDKEFISKNRCMYNMMSDSGMTYYQLLKNMVIEYGNGSIKSDPYPGFDKLDLDSCFNPPPSPPSSPSSPCPPCPSPYNQPLRNQPDKAMSKKSDYNFIFKVTIATLLFIILSNQKVYEFTNKLFPTLLPSSCPSEIGNILHAVVFFLLFYVLLYLIK